MENGMALDDDDIKKLDKHMVEPLLEGIERLGARIDAAENGLGAQLDGLGDRLDRVDVHVEVLGAQLVKLAAESNSTLSAIAAQQRASAASADAFQENMNRWMTIERDEINGRLRALEAWRAEVEKKTRH
jgi:hypothetical protein